MSGSQRVKPKTRSDGTGSVYKTAEGRWVAQVRRWDEHLGRSVKTRRYASSRDEAREKLKELREGVAVAPSSANPSMTVADWLDVYEATALPVSGLSAATIEQSHNLIANPLKPTLGEVRLSRFDAAEVDLWLGRLAQARRRPVKGQKTPPRPLAPSTRRSAHTVLTRALDAAVRADLIAENPLRRARAPKVGPRPDVPVLTAAQVDHLLEVAEGDDLYPLLVFVADTGCRVGEALALTWDRVDLEAASAVLVATKTGGRRRAVPLVPDVVDALKTQRKWQAEHRLMLGSGWSDNGLVFTTAVGTPVDPHNARRDLRRLLRKAGTPVERPWHTLRHSLATRLLGKGVPMPVVSAILGHSSIRTTVDTYGHVEPAMGAEAMAAALATTRRAT